MIHTYVRHIVEDLLRIMERVVCGGSEERAEGAPYWDERVPNLPKEGSTNKSQITRPLVHPFGSRSSFVKYIQPLSSFRLILDK